MPALRDLKLSDAVLHLPSFNTFVSNHARTLGVLELNTIRLEQGTWTACIYALPQVTQLKHFSATLLFGGFVPLDADSHGPQVYLHQHEGKAYQSLWDYVLRGGEWPGLINESAEWKVKCDVAEAEYEDNLGWE
jgi:hypothetical protein